LRQNTAFGVNVLENADVLEQVENWGKWLTTQIQNPKDRSRCAIENCISALGLLMLNQPNKVTFRTFLLQFCWKRTKKNAFFSGKCPKSIFLNRFKFSV
tara:strand:+ start:179 stop:475 length:297 start_codon:yes stop_codon:yes gene_type:complete